MLAGKDAIKDLKEDVPVPKGELDAAVKEHLGKYDSCGQLLTFLSPQIPGLVLLNHLLVVTTLSAVGMEACIDIEYEK